MGEELNGTTTCEDACAMDAIHFAERSREHSEHASCVVPGTAGQKQFQVIRRDEIGGTIRRYTRTLSMIDKGRW